MTRNLFAYGTLLVPEIWNLVVGKPFRSEAATLPGFEIRRVKGWDFPGIMESANSDARVEGRVFFDLDAASVERLDAYEDSFYERLEIEVQLVELPDAKQVCDTYVVPDLEARRILGDELWTLEWFREHAEAGYLERMRSL